MGLKRAKVSRAFTLTELLVVVGLIAVLISLMLPALTKARAAANAAGCLSNLRQLGTAWTIYLSENRGRLPEQLVHVPAGSPDLAWRVSWLGILEENKVPGAALLCPSASEPAPKTQSNNGYGTALYAWTGRWTARPSMVRLSSMLYRVGSYGYNAHLSSGGGFEEVKGITGLKQVSDVPVILDAVSWDFAPASDIDKIPEPPPNLRGNLPANPADHWRFLIARHGRGINSFMADGSARWVPLDETYMLTWKHNWHKQRLSLPAY